MTGISGVQTVRVPHDRLLISSLTFFTENFKRIFTIFYFLPAEDFEFDFKNMLQVLADSVGFGPRPRDFVVGASPFSR